MASIELEPGYFEKVYFEVRQATIRLVDFYIIIATFKPFAEILFLLFYCL